MNTELFWGSRCDAGCDTPCDTGPRASHKLSRCRSSTHWLGDVQTLGDRFSDPAHEMLPSDSRVSMCSDLLPQPNPESPPYGLSHRRFPDTLLLC